MLTEKKIITPEALGQCDEFLKILIFHLRNVITGANF